MLSGIKPLTVTKRQAKELLSPKLVDRLIYAAKNFPEMGWLEILPKEEGKEVRETYIVYESLERAFQRIRGGEYPPDFPSDIKDRKKRQGAESCPLGAELDRVFDRPFRPASGQGQGFIVSG